MHVGSWVTVALGISAVCTNKLNVGFGKMKVEDYQHKTVSILSRVLMKSLEIALVWGKAG